MYGAASMGALRAAELDSFGMMGHGQVYEAYASGSLEDDDEVAVVHSMAEFGFRPLSDAMVNIRHTLAEAARAGVISSDEATALLTHFKRRHFPERCLAPALEQVEVRALLSYRAHTDLKEWLPNNYRDVKREDACSLLRMLAHKEPRTVASAKRSFLFQSTVNWIQLSESIRVQVAAESSTNHSGMSEPIIGEDDMLIEAQLEGGWPALQARALARLAASCPQAHLGPVTESEYLDQLASTCFQLDLADLNALLAWMAAVGWTPEHLATAMAREAVFARAQSYWSSETRSVARDLLFLEGRAQRLLRRSSDKRRQLELSPVLSDTGQDDLAEALSWYREQTGMAKVDSDELLARLNGWMSESDMKEEVLREYRYRRVNQSIDD